MLTGSADDDTSGSEDECDQGNTTTVTNSSGGALTDIHVQCKLDYINYRKVSNMFYNVGTSTCTSSRLRPPQLSTKTTECVGLKRPLSDSTNTVVESPSKILKQQNSLGEL